MSKEVAPEYSEHALNTCRQPRALLIDYALSANT